MDANHPLIGRELRILDGHRHVLVIVDRVSVRNNFVWCHNKARPQDTYARRPHEFTTTTGENITI